MDFDVIIWESTESEFQNRLESKSFDANEFAEIIMATFVYNREKLRAEISKLSGLGDDERQKTELFQYLTF